MATSTKQRLTFQLKGDWSDPDAHVITARITGVSRDDVSAVISAIETGIKAIPVKEEAPAD